MFFQSSGFLYVGNDRENGRMYEFLVSPDKSF